VEHLHPQGAVDHRIVSALSGYRRPVRLLAPAAVTVLLLALTGCSEPDPGSPMPTGAAPAQPSATESAPSASPTAPSATTDPTQTPMPAPTLPPEATTNDAAGAEAFVRYWYESANYSIATGDVGLVEALSAEDCQTCQRLVDIVEDQYASGGSFRGGQSEVSQVVAPRPDDSGYVVAAFVLEQEPPLAVGPQGDVQNQGEADHAESYLQMSMRWEGRAWRALEIAQ